MWIIVCDSGGDMQLSFESDRNGVREVMGDCDGLRFITGELWLIANRCANCSCGCYFRRFCVRDDLQRELVGDKV